MRGLRLALHPAEQIGTYTLTMAPTEPVTADLSGLMELAQDFRDELRTLALAQCGISVLPWEKAQASS